MSSPLDDEFLEDIPEVQEILSRVNGTAYVLRNNDFANEAEQLEEIFERLSRFIEFHHGSGNHCLRPGVKDLLEKIATFAPRIGGGIEVRKAIKALKEYEPRKWEN